jgi:hypothetical protein
MQTVDETFLQATPEQTGARFGGTVEIFPETQERLENSFYLSEEWALTCRVAASKGLSRSSLLPKFLLHICEQSLRGNSRDLTEQRIGTSIFNRAPDYDPGEDNIVRSYARTLRRRLDEYFKADGSREPIRIVVPRGGYVPTFERVTQPELAEPDSQNTESTGLMQPRIMAPTGSTKVEMKDSSRSAGRMLFLGFLAGTIAWLGLWALLHGKQQKQVQSPSHQIWAELFQQNKNTVIVPADSGLGILQNLSQRQVSLQEYANGSYFADAKTLPGVDAGSIADLRQQRYTSVVDLNIITRIMQLPEFTSSRTGIRFARNITTEDLKSLNVILLGSVHSNPWVALFEDRLNFKLKYMPEVNQSFVLNERPAGNEQKQYSNDSGTMANKTYGVIDYLPNLDGNGHVLIIQGLNMAATQAAADTLSHLDTMNSILKLAVRADGTVRPFELLIKTSSIGATDQGLEIVATRFYK